jgi:hypothetical protein
MTLGQIRAHVRQHLVRLSNDESNLTHGSVWTDAELNDLINHAVRDFQRGTGQILTKETVAFTDGVGSLSAATTQLKRVEVGSTVAEWLYLWLYPETMPDFTGSVDVSGALPEYITLKNAEGESVYLWPNTTQNGWNAEDTPPV